MERSVRFECSELKYPFGEFLGGMSFIGSGSDRMTSLKNLPTHCRAIRLINQAIEKIDEPISCNVLRMDHNKITSVVGIHKFVKCRMIVVDDNPIEGSILDIMKIPGLDEVDMSAESGTPSLHKALEIIDGFLPIHSNADIVSAQRALIEADLDEFA